MLDTIEKRLPELNRLAVTYEKDYEQAELKHRHVVEELMHLERIYEHWKTLFSEELSLQFVLKEEEQSENVMELANVNTTDIQRFTKEGNKRHHFRKINEKLLPGAAKISGISYDRRMVGDEP